MPNNFKMLMIRAQFKTMFLPLEACGHLYIFYYKSLYFPDNFNGAKYIDNFYIAFFGEMVPLNPKTFSN